MVEERIRVSLHLLDCISVHPAYETSALYILRYLLLFLSQSCESVNDDTRYDLNDKDEYHEVEDVVVDDAAVLVVPVVLVLSLIPLRRPVSRIFRVVSRPHIPANATASFKSLVNVDNVTVDKGACAIPVRHFMVEESESHETEHVLED